MSAMQKTATKSHAGLWSQLQAKTSATPGPMSPAKVSSDLVGGDPTALTALRQPLRTTLPARVPGRGALPRVTILTANVGGGHKAASRSLSEAFEDKALVSQVSMIDEHAPFPLNTLGPTYAPWVNYTPWLYRMVYRIGESRERVVAMQKAVYPLLKKYVSTIVRPEETDLFISVHPLQIEMPLWYMEEIGQRIPFVTVVTDPVTAPLAWFCPDVDLCVVATEPAYQTGLSCGIEPARLKLIGLPIRRGLRADAGVRQAGYARPAGPRTEEAADPDVGGRRRHRAHRADGARPGETAGAA